MKRSRTTALSAERRIVYADSSALVKLVIDEPESGDLARHLGSDTPLVTSRIAVVEVTRATRIASAAPEIADDTAALLAACMRLEVSERVLRQAVELSSRSVRTLDAVHLASAIVVEADEFLTYDRRLAAAARETGLAVAAPGGDSPE
ncbi:type II toxin-antitoxin system VapC family toxin [Thermoleophilia bacterium SCSIO 60948]|nr:type II toxin-antitoxin system VapC family toxin [Thermoleophilia bacterium SCSIO 60948]